MQFPMSNDSQLAVTPSTMGLAPSSGLHGHLRAHIGLTIFTKVDIFVQRVQN